MSVRSLSAALRLLVAAVLFFTLTSAVSAAPYIWSGTVSGAWSDGGNWVGGTAPPSGQPVDLIFPAGASNTQTAPGNDISGLTVHTITFNGTNYYIRGDSISLSGGITDNATGGNNSLLMDIQITASQAFNVGDFTESLVLDGTVSGSGSISKDGDGGLGLEGQLPNSYVGSTFVNGGSFSVGGMDGVVDIPGNLVIGDGVIGAYNVLDSFYAGANGTLASTAAVTVNSSGFFDVATGVQHIASLAFSPGGVLGITFEGTSPGDTTTGGYGQVTVAAAVNVSNGKLSPFFVRNVYTPNVGDHFTILHSVGGITGTLSNLPQGGSLADSGVTFVANYTANDLVLTVASVVPEPSVSTYTPDVVDAGGPGFLLTINGTGFASGDTVAINNGAQSAPASLTSTAVTVNIPASVIASPGLLNVTIYSPDGTNASVTITVRVSTVVIASLNPNSVAAGGPGFPLTITGSGFVAGATIALNNGSPLTPLSTTATQVVVPIPAFAIANAGTINVTVRNPNGEGTSNAAPLTVGGTPLAITSLSPATVALGSTGVTLTATGTGFASGDTVTFNNGAGVTPASLSGTQLTVPVPDSLLTTRGAISVRVVNAASGISSNAATLTVADPAPAITDLSPSSISVGSRSTSLTITGTGFVSGATVTVGGTSLTPSATSPTQILVTVPPSLLATAGALPVIITNPDGQSSPPVNLTVAPVVPTALTLSPTSVVGGTNASALVTLNAAAPAGGVVLRLTGSVPAVILPASITLPVGSRSAAFTVQTAGVATQTTATVTITLNGVSQSATLTITPVSGGGGIPGPTTVILSALTLSPTSVTGGTAPTAVVTLTGAAPAGGLTVTLASASPALAFPPASVTVPAGATSETAVIATSAVGAPISVNITATQGAVTLTAPLTLLPRASSGVIATYSAGLHMISLPYEYNGISPDDIFGYSRVTLAAWVTHLGEYALTGAVPAETIHLGRGYFVRFPQAVTVTLPGTPADPAADFPITLEAGWNQIGDPFTTPVPLSRLAVQTGSGGLSYAQATTGRNAVLGPTVYRYDASANGGHGAYTTLGAGDSLQPGEGYWIKGLAPVALIVPHP